MHIPSILMFDFKHIEFIRACRGVETGVVRVDFEREGFVVTFILQDLVSQEVLIVPSRIAGLTQCGTGSAGYSQLV